MGLSITRRCLSNLRRDRPEVGDVIRRAVDAIEAGADEDEVVLVARLRA